MNRLRPFRFGVVAFSASSRQEWREKARRAEGIGYDTFLVPDHLIGGQLGAIPAIAAAAESTRTIRVGSFVLNAAFRHPAVLAQDAATLDLLSDGRLEFGLGAGWNTRDYEQLGIPYDTPKIRVDRMEEALALIKRLWTEETVTHEGAHYRVRDAKVLPRPTQRPHPPVMIGGGGPRMLRIAAREAQIVAIAPSITPSGVAKVGTVTVGSVEKRIATLRDAPRFSELELNVIVFDAQVTDAAQSTVSELAARLKSGITSVVDTPFFMYGSRASLVEDLIARRERLGISYIALPGSAMRAFAPVVAELRGK